MRRHLPVSGGVVSLRRERIANRNTGNQMEALGQERALGMAFGLMRNGRHALGRKGRHDSGNKCIRLLSVLPNAELVSFLSLGHVPHEEAPEPSLAPVRKFLAK